MTQEELIAAVKALQEKNGGDLLGLAVKLYDDNHGFREKNRTLKEENAALKGRALPDGAVVLSPEEASAWGAFKALGKPEEIKAQLASVPELQGKLSKIERDRLIDEVAAFAGWKPGVLRRMPDVDKLTFELRDEQQDGTGTKVPYVKDASGQTRKADEFGEAEWPEFMPALKAEPAKPAGTPWIEQPSGGKPIKKDPAASYIGKAYADPKK